MLSNSKSVPLLQRSTSNTEIFCRSTGRYLLMSIRKAAFSALKWSILSEVVSRLAGPLVFLILARLLTPTDYGVVAAAAVLVSFSQIFSDAGLAKALVQRQKQDVNSDANVVFWCNFSLSLLIYVSLCLFAKEISIFFNETRIDGIIPVAALQLVFASLGAVQNALLQRSLEFKKIFLVRSVSSFVPGLLSVPFAIGDYGYWALVAGSVFGQFVQCILLWKLSAWRPTLQFNLRIASEMIGFGKWVALSGVFGWFYGWADTLVVGRYLGAYDMGLYRTGNTLVMMVFGMLFTPVLPVLYSVFSKKSNENDVLLDAVRYVLHATALVAIPVGTMLYLSAFDVGSLIFGRKWIGIDLVIGVLALVHGTGALVSSSGEVFRAKGMPHLESAVMGGTIVLYIFGYLYSITFGLSAFLWTRLLLVCLSLVPHIYYLRLALNANVASLISPFITSLLSSAVSLGLVSLLIDTKEHSLGMFFLRVFIFGGTYLLCVIVLDGHFVRSVITDVVQRKSSRGGNDG